ncbi:hypothetical protein BGX33_011912 [Mortierella sp. NVP41]|nr:hypothetical protein BGX33_011912 [Mortierella sp. NVP41]
MPTHNHFPQNIESVPQNIESVPEIEISSTQYRRGRGMHHFPQEPGYSQTSRDSSVALNTTIPYLLRRGLFRYLVIALNAILQLANQADPHCPKTSRPFSCLPRRASSACPGFNCRPHSPNKHICQVQPGSGASIAPQQHRTNLYPLKMRTRAPLGYSVQAIAGEPLKPQKVHNERFAFEKIAMKTVKENYGLDASSLRELATITPPTLPIPCANRLEVQKRTMRRHGGWVGVAAAVDQQLLKRRESAERQR